MENSIPQESETIAARRAIRVKEKLAQAKNSLAITKAWWSNGPMEGLGLLAIFILNFFLVYSFFGTQSPVIYFSGPVIPLFAKAMGLFLVTLPYGIQITNAAFFVFFPLTFYLFVKKITGRKATAFLAVLISCLPIYPFGLVRIYGMFLGQDGPHIASLTIIPLAIYGLLSFIRDGGIRNLVIASVSSGLIALISPFGFMTFAAIAGITAFSEMLLGKGRLKIVRLIVVFAFAAGLNSFWYNPAFFVWMITGPMGEEIRETISKLVPISFFVIPVLAAFGYLLFDRKPQLQPVFLASFYTIAFAIIALAGGGLFPSHPSRYLAEFGISLAFLISIATVKFAEYIKFSPSPRFQNINRGLVANGVLTLAFLGTAVGIILGRDMHFGNERVLGIWTDVGKGDIWVAKENFGGAYSILGHTITLSALATLSFLGIKTKPQTLG
ncbi:hypothetical protein A2115_01425 [Candidatus Woesebacteria bacterium GWA1_41_8]|uniref:Glycosyltransferase RgtA/B/C/D-like domain-containing protein n=1 Tax=Candidatus Woesebacteria bacterium GWA1_41_8 TaxID=1802471 RepID=A0A1F7WH62_9BACT|nr:MAG: hypothetical protein A2115_01425 [Candidatus Woesebacteria bacterium GWA1_41_8]